MEKKERKPVWRPRKIKEQEIIRELIFHFFLELKGMIFQAKGLTKYLELRMKINWHQGTFQNSGNKKEDPTKIE